MQHWPDRRLLDLLNIEIPIIQAPRAGSDSVALARSVSSTGALGSLACALLSPDRVREAMGAPFVAVPGAGAGTACLCFFVEGGPGGRWEAMCWAAPGFQ
jgi:nitronate monooxygenase